MSRYSVQYTSASKGAMNIEDMPDGHLHNAARKLHARLAENSDSLTDHELDVMQAMDEEIAARAAAADENKAFDPEGT